MGINLFDIFYGIGGAAMGPYWLARSRTREKVALALRQRMGRVQLRQAAGGPGRCVMIHAVSLGEINATRALVAHLRNARGDLRFVVSTTTQTGFDRAVELYGSQTDLSVVRYPLDLSWAVRRMLEIVCPDVVVLIELEVWPNFVAACTRSDIPVLLINGRLTGRSFKRYRLVRPLLRRSFARLWRVCVQDEIYRQRFLALGCDAASVHVSGTMKFDTAAAPAPDPAVVSELAAAVGLTAGPIWVCGSTGPGEEQLVLNAYRRLLGFFPKLRLAIVPRKPERFDEVADLIAAEGFAVLRRSRNREANATPAPEAPRPTVVLGDTLGELRHFYALADVVFVGRTLVDLGPRQHGSDMIEPAALGKAVVVGPFTGNFADAMHHFRRAGAIVRVASAEELFAQTQRLLGDPAAAATTGTLAKQVVLSQLGATPRHAEAILAALAQRERAPGRLAR